MYPSKKKIIIIIITIIDFSSISVTDLFGWADNIGRVDISSHTAFLLRDECPPVAPGTSFLQPIIQVQQKKNTFFSLFSFALRPGTTCRADKLCLGCFISWVFKINRGVGTKRAESPGFLGQFHPFARSPLSCLISSCHYRNKGTKSPK